MDQWCMWLTLDSMFLEVFSKLNNSRIPSISHSVGIQQQNSLLYLTPKFQIPAFQRVLDYPKHGFWHLERENFHLGKAPHISFFIYYGIFGISPAREVEGTPWIPGFHLWGSGMCCLVSLGVAVSWECWGFPQDGHGWDSAGKNFCKYIYKM